MKSTMWAAANESQPTTQTQAHTCGTNITFAHLYASIVVFDDGLLAEACALVECDGPLIACLHMQVDLHEPCTQQACHTRTRMHSTGSLLRVSAEVICISTEHGDQQTGRPLGKWQRSPSDATTQYALQQAGRAVLSVRCQLLVAMEGDAPGTTQLSTTTDFQ